MADFVFLPGKLALLIIPEIPHYFLSRPLGVAKISTLEAQSHLLYFPLDEIEILLGNITGEKQFLGILSELVALENHFEVSIVEGFGFGLPGVERVVEGLQRNPELLAQLAEVEGVELVLEVLLPQRRVHFSCEFLPEFLNYYFVNEFHVLFETLLRRLFLQLVNDCCKLLSWSLRGKAL